MNYVKEYILYHEYDSKQKVKASFSNKDIFFALSFICISHTDIKTFRFVGIIKLFFLVTDNVKF